MTKATDITKASVVIQKDLHLAADILRPFKPGLEKIDLGFMLDRRLPTGELEFDIGTDAPLKHKSPFEIVAFINKIAAVFNYPPVLALTKHITKREVFVKFMSDERHWIDEAYWLAVSAALQPGSEATRRRHLVEALARMRRREDSVTVTFGPTLSQEAAALLIGAHGTQFIILARDRNKLAAVGRPGYIPAKFHITLEYRTPVLNTTRIADELAPYLESVESVFMVNTIR
ncbi:MAG TPA: hypothetical protein VMT81_03595 [Candidatus Paceibacterota bacterium]|nr:hypothetical protein [Candidatus Paceibacterota bacterium]